MGHRILEHWELRLAAIWLKEQGTGTFMGTVAPAGQLPPSSQQGKLHTSSTGLLADTEIAYRIGNRRVQALFTTGFRTSAPVHQTYNAELAGLQIPFNSSLPQPSISPLAGVSLRWRCIKTTFIETGVTFGRIKNIGWKPTVDFGLGVGF
ncbi:MAG: hypothetical protein IPL65_08725 [Lewinellaceae bacterium]|nr:hypothetical protein [Lewinellaceae bacterium]